MHSLPAPNCEGLAVFQRMAFDTTDARHVESRARAQHGWHIDAAGDREISACADTGKTASQRLAGGHGDTLPQGQGLAVERGVHLGASEGNHAIVREAQGRAHKLAFQPCHLRPVADQYIGQAERPHVERPGRRETLLPKAVTAGEILYRGFQAGFNHLEFACHG